MKNRLFVTTFFLSSLVFLLAYQCQAQFAYDYVNPIEHDNITSFLKGILVSVQGIASWLAVIFIVIGGILYLTASGKDSQLTIAKNTIVYALIGFALAVAGPSLLREIQDLVLGTGSGGNAIDDANSLYSILENVLEFILTLIGILSLMSLIYSGYTYLSSMGDREKTDKAKKIAFYSILALTISGGSLIVIQTIITFLSV